MRNLPAEAVAGINRALTSVPADSIDQLVVEIAGAPRTFFSGAGRSFLMIKSLAMALMQIGYTVHATGEVTTPNVGPGDLLIVASSSGETPSVMLFVEQALSVGARVAVITGNPASSMAKAADLVVVMGDGSDPHARGWETGSFFELALGPLGDCVVEQLASSIGATHSTIAANHANME